MKKILYIGDDKLSSTSRHRFEALKRLGYDAIIYNPRQKLNIFFYFSLFNFFHYHTGYFFLQKVIKKWIENILAISGNIDLIWVNNGEFFGPSCLIALRAKGCPVILYNNDDPCGGRDGNRFRALKKSIPFYDLCAVVRDINIIEYYNLGAKNVIRVSMSYDEVYHKPESFIKRSNTSYVSFIGTWMRYEKRDEFLLYLIEKKIPVTIYGDHWNKSKYYDKLKNYIKGPAIYNQDYVSGIQGSKICLGFLSKGNRDLYTRRSVEIPFIGSLFVAERTPEHEKMYLDGNEAFFWSNKEECASILIKLLSDHDLIEKVRIAGMKRVRDLKVGNEDICKAILNNIL
ncbi:CgeB family protein [Persicitalea jodogahamensis]|uniref:Spore protein YkvP/CgeB glycosyl transferase-like domain-containing protein n=1 Tax=Persicitalea jodogahamensis TaxID=402147 RepID=A0A8J3D2P5_9BACT|nr:glycosyltransferase [Persicitalea jodogahamensis]GHB62966.1 hypothetical protein GCM10007390_16000 [Persicitalea jodogahamensis]